MTTKKKTVSGTKAAAPRSGAAAQTVAAPLKVPAAAKTAEAPTPSARQLQEWGRAVALFTRGQFEEAREAFREVAKGPAAHISDKARSYLQICERKTARPDLEFSTAEEHFNYGVDCLNARDIARARFHLERSRRLDPEADNISYALALCCALASDGNGTAEHLRHAIEREPHNRVLARQEPEFNALALRFPPLRSLLGTA